jgi:hypothetical protein
MMGEVKEVVVQRIRTGVGSGGGPHLTFAAAKEKPAVTRDGEFDEDLSRARSVVAMDGLTDLTLSCAATAHVPKPVRRGGCRE